MKASKLILIEWEDSNHRPGWTSDEVVCKPTICHSVGWLVGESKSAMTLCANINNEPNCREQRCGDMTILRSCIRKVRKLKPQ